MIRTIISFCVGLGKNQNMAIGLAGEQAMMTMTSGGTVDLLGRALVNEGVWDDPTSFILSASHTEQDIKATLERYESALQAVRSEGAI